MGSMPRNTQTKFQDNLTSTMDGFRTLKKVINLFTTIDPRCSLLREMISQMPQLDPIFESLDVLLSLETNPEGGIWTAVTSFINFFTIIRHCPSPRKGQEI